MSYLSSGTDRQLTDTMLKPSTEGDHDPMSTAPKASVDANAFICSEEMTNDADELQKDLKVSEYPASFPQMQASTEEHEQSSGNFASTYMKQPPRVYAGGSGHYVQQLVVHNKTIIFLDPNSLKRSETPLTKSVSSERESVELSGAAATAHGEHANVEKVFVITLQR